MTGSKEPIQCRNYETESTRSRVLALGSRVCHSRTSRRPEVQVEPAEVHLRSMRRKWGSCSTNGRVTFDTELLRQHASFRRRVIVEELGPSVRESAAPNEAEGRSWVEYVERRGGLRKLGASPSWLSENSSASTVPPELSSVVSTSDAWTKSHRARTLSGR